MEWSWPAGLYLLGLLPLSAAVYVWVLRRRRYAVRYSSLALVRAARPPGAALRRHLPFGLWLLALGSLVGALARPVATVTLPSARATVMLVLDVSLSMCATDIAPSRLRAAEAAALAFIRQQPPSTQIGVVTFASFAVLAQAPTTDQRSLQSAVANLDTGLGTAIGSGLLTALEAIDDVQTRTGPAAAASAAPPQPGYAPEIIVLLTDGVTTVGVPPIEAAQQAAQRGVRVYPIGFGTAEGALVHCNEDQRAASATLGSWGPPAGQSGGYHEGLDEGTLRQIAALTGGTYYSAQSAGELQAVLAGLPAVAVTQRERMEISVAFAALGALLSLAAMGLGLRWNRL